ncbi:MULTISPECIES: hypothetical protein [unclassified Tenacibaculum]|uniref:hypothetical protein n=1 Tax=unclassified Tenacibaculum TaxID=2635139 RepID=UPI001F19B4A7|nr:MULTISPECIES: hypothetical protein [unclassified Tenacibaculum]MCF2873220.1 hypothetical protein [Tenacibaculum sp. Cn5-1]MCF2933376.1 hypothetical protein [Tenacibaculum sp. Cn5-34]MCG7510043.1 hypothetical protein [Tenacibaculum sp. Cn5-46]
MIHSSNILKFTVTILLLTFTISTQSQEINVVDKKGTVNTVNNNNVYTSATDPNTPTPVAVENDIWFDTSTTPNTIKVWDGTTWLSLANNFWSLAGNGGTNPTTNFLGTSDGQDLAFRTNNIEAMRINQSNQYVGLGIVGATSPLHISRDLADGIGIIRVQGTEPDINFNDTDGGFNTFTFENAGVAKFAFGRRNTDAFYITRNDGTWHDETFNILNNNGHVGLNTDAPTERLDVNGKLRVRDISTVTTNNNILTATATGVVEKKELIAAETDNQITTGANGGVYLGPTVFVGSFIINGPGGGSATFTQDITGLPFQPSQITFTAHANIESANIDNDNGVGNNNAWINNSFGTMNGFVRDTGAPFTQQVIYVGGHGNSINDISRYASNSNCIGIRYGSQNGDDLGKITASLNTFLSNGFRLNVAYSLGTIGSTARRNDVLNESLLVIYTAYK